jgi:transcriptional regulator with XRE-family HTH domain
MDSETGSRLREIRSKTGLSQRQLAKASGVANATISQIESGALNPTVGMLKKVLGGIPISLSNFFAAWRRWCLLFAGGHSSAEQIYPDDEGVLPAGRPYRQTQYSA